MFLQILFLLINQLWVQRNIFCQKTNSYTLRLKKQTFQTCAFFYVLILFVGFHIVWESQIFGTQEKIKIQIKGQRCSLAITACKRSWVQFPATKYNRSRINANICHQQNQRKWVFTVERTSFFLILGKYSQRIFFNILNSYFNEIGSIYKLTYFPLVTWSHSHRYLRAPALRQGPGLQLDHQRPSAPAHSTSQASWAKRIVCPLHNTGGTFNTGPDTKKNSVSAVY